MNLVAIRSVTAPNRCLLSNIQPLKKAIGEVYRPGSIIGDGGTADIIKFEKETGILLSKLTME